MGKTHSKTPLIFFITVIILMTIATLLLVNKCATHTPTTDDGPSSTSPHPTNNDSDDITLTPEGNHVDDKNTNPYGSPTDLIGHISELAIQANDTGDINPLVALLGQGTLTPTQTKQLRELAVASRMKLDPTTPFSSIQGLNNRWSLNLANRNRIFLDLTKAADGRWLVNRITLPNHQGSLTKQPKKTTDPATSDEEKKAAAIVQSFLASIMQLDPASARQYIDPTKISYAKLAGLCILFEEGKYQFIEKKALRNMFLRNTSAGWIARIKTPDTDQPAMFAINTKRQDAQSAWKITEINLNQLLTDYVNRVSGGDIHYKPLIKNPKGGDALVIYFDLNSNQLTIRTQRQLIIVAKLLKTDAQRKLTISGYTDALGSDAYNLVLSEKRARQVMLFLSKNGVNPAQMNIASFGEAQPRVPNTSADGSDAPEGRRVNRRAEILLDF